MILARAPMRISLGGGGTDLPSYYTQYGGFILSAAINKYVYVYLNRPSADKLLRVKYSRYEEVDSVDQIQHDLVRPALKLLNLNGNLEIVSMADVPAGTGLGSSGTYLVALLCGLNELRREKVPTQALAETACHIEMDLAGHPVGKHDHYLAAYGGFTCMEISQKGKVQVSTLDISLTTLEEMHNSILLFYTSLTRSSTAILQEQKTGTEDGDRTTVESLHKTRELGYQVKKALELGNLDQFGRLLHVHWENKKKRSRKISDARIDRCYELAREHGALGGKIVGAGGGGFLMLYCPNHSKANVRQAMAAEGLDEMSYNFDFEGAKVLVNF